MDDMTYRMAEGWLDGGRPLEALSMLEHRRTELLETAAGAMLLGRAYFKTAQLGKAEEVLRRAVELGPTDSYARYLLGRTLQRQSRHVEALPHLKLAAAQNPEYAGDRDTCAARIA
ncbi:tetratricopeptide repeat protein [Pseudonocardia sp. WMMC193]|uniref:tetratricopeptide repeat protein n=1 Tax=Pseudonocardia sp. WMMC193 TaxID=2911965 RepID=UPI001F2BA49E|nr:tetratricopeptide repeat protein [Pseudonocardia sp. WMMC193]MCF7552463.1 tetratricopeptide repeat protein [Pseudonocardia sp. WMMC193]